MQPAKANQLVRWQPQAIQKPTIDRKLTQLDALPRSTECIRYALLSFEHWLSADGKLREWIRFNARIAVSLAVPVCMAFPVLTLALWELEAWSNALTSIAAKLASLPILTLLSLVLILKLFGVLKR